MNITNALVSLRDDIKTWVTNNLNKKSSVDHRHYDEGLQPMYIEFSGTGTSGGYLDFHYGGSTNDYTSRIAELSEGRLSVLAPNGVEFQGGIDVSSHNFVGNNGDLNTCISDVSKRATKINLTGQLQGTSYRHSVIAMCKTSDANTSADSYSTGRLYLHRNNGLYGITAYDVSIEGAYGPANGIYASLMGYTQTGSSERVRPCTFSYNGVIYGGLEIYISAAELQIVEFVGETNFDIFALDYYSDTDEVLNEEVYNSLLYASTSNTVNFVNSAYFNDNYLVQSSGCRQIKVLTQAEYDALTTKDSEIIYLTT